MRIDSFNLFIFIDFQFPFYLLKDLPYIFEFLWPPFNKTFFTPKPISLFAAKIISLRLLILIFVRTSASGIFGVNKNAFLINFFSKFLLLIY